MGVRGKFQHTAPGLGTWLAGELARRGIGLAEAAELTGLHRERLGELVRGARGDPRLSTLQALARGLAHDQLDVVLVGAGYIHPVGELDPELASAVVHAQRRLTPQQQEWLAAAVWRAVLAAEELG